MQIKGAQIFKDTVMEINPKCKSKLCSRLALASLSVLRSQKYNPKLESMRNWAEALWPFKQEKINVTDWFKSWVNVAVDVYW